MRANLSIDELEFDIEIPNSLQWNESLANKIVEQLSEVLDAIEEELDEHQIEIDSLEIDLGVINSLEDIKTQLFYQFISHLKNPRYLDQVARKTAEVQPFELSQKSWKETLLLLSQNDHKSVTISNWIEKNEITWNEWLTVFKDLSI